MDTDGASGQKGSEASVCYGAGRDIAAVTVWPLPSEQGMDLVVLVLIINKVETHNEQLHKNNYKYCNMFFVCSFVYCLYFARDFANILGLVGVVYFCNCWISFLRLILMMVRIPRIWSQRLLVAAVMSLMIHQLVPLRKTSPFVDFASYMHLGVLQFHPLHR